MGLKPVLRVLVSDTQKTSITARHGMSQIIHYIDSKLGYTKRTSKLCSVMSKRVFAQKK